MLFEALGKHLTAREHTVFFMRYVLPDETPMSSRNIGKILMMSPSTVLNHEKSAWAKIRQPWRLTKLRRRIGLKAFKPHRFDKVTDWFPVSPSILGLLQKTGRGTLYALASKNAVGLHRRHTLKPHCELELHRLIDDVRALLKQKED